MERQLERCGGLDVHKETVAVCVRVGGRTGKAEQHVQTFGTTVNLDVIVSGGTALIAAKRATSAIPIVVANMADPVADGLVVSLARPGSNVTGNTLLGPELGPKRLQLLREVIPQVSRVAALQHPGVYSERTMQNMLKELERTAASSG